MTMSRDAFLRYSRHLLMADIGEEGQQRLLASRVLIVGLGGLGCPVALYLTAAGVGELILCEPDQVDLSNLQRQVMYRLKDVGLNKATVALRELAALNPDVKVAARPTVAEELEQQSAAPLGRVDVVVDCTDNLAARHWLNRYCHQRRIPFVSAAAMGWEGQLMTFDFTHQSSPCLACVIAEDSAEPLLNCGNSGVLGPLLGVMGSMQAISVIRLLLADSHRAHLATQPRLQRFDARRELWSSFALARNVGCSVCGEAKDTEQRF